jgi:hypothetical protein
MLTRAKQFAMICSGVACMRFAAYNGGTRGKRISFRVSILASGSTGNCTLLESGCTTLLIDAGVGRKEMLRRFEALGRARPENVDGILSRNLLVIGNAPRTLPSPPTAKC